MKYLNKHKIHLAQPYNPVLSMCSRPIPWKERRANHRKTFNQLPKEERCGSCDKIVNGAPDRAYWAGKKWPESRLINSKKGKSDAS